MESGTILGGYRIDAVAGQGGMGVVYRATQLGLDRPVALKVIASELADNLDFRNRFKSESQLAASIDHPNVVPVYEAGESEHGLYLAMQLVPGPTLAVLYQERALDAARGLALLRQVGDALDAAHTAGLVHRDVKPQNVLVGETENAYLGDFALPRSLGELDTLLTPQVKKMVSHQIAKDLTGASPPDLWHALEKVLPTAALA